MQSSQTTNPSPLWTAVRWISAIIALGIIVMAVLIGQGVWGGERNLIPGHGHLGNALFGLAAVQFVLAVVLNLRKGIPAAHMVITFALLVLLLAQAGLGYSGRSDSSLIAWHVPLGVTLMGMSTFNAALAWLRPAATPAHARRESLQGD